MPGLSARELKDLLQPRLPLCEIVFLSKLIGPGEATHWHIVTNIVDKWGRHVRRARRLLESLREADEEEARILAAGIDETVLGRPPTLRAPRSVKMFGELDDRYYRAVAIATPDRFRIIDDPDLDRFGFLTSPEAAAVERVKMHAWTVEGTVLPVPDFDKVMPFDYSLRYAKDDDVRAIVKEWYDTRGLSFGEKLSVAQWEELTEEVVKYLNQFFAHAMDGGVYVVTAPHNYNPGWNPHGTVVLARNTYKHYTVDSVTRNFRHFNSNLWPPHKRNIVRVEWVAEWLAHGKQHKYETAYGFSKPLMTPDHINEEIPPVFNTWTGPGVWPQEAFEAVKKNPQEAIETVDFFIEYLQHIVCGDPFEHPAYNNFAFTLLVHFLIWLIKRPHDPFPVVLYFWSPEQGVGKGQLTALMTLLVGLFNTHSGTGVNGLNSSFLGYIADKLLWIMDEESSREKEIEANGTIKRVATEPLISGEKKYQDPRLINNAVKLVASSNQLRPIKLGERRWFSVAFNASRRANTAYWNEFVQRLLTSSGYLYVAAWLLGISPHPDVKPGMAIPKGYLRVRQAEKDSITDPLQAVLMPWFATANLSTEVAVKYVEEEGYVVPFETEHEVFSIDPLDSRFAVPAKKFIDDWFAGGNPGASAPHYNQPMLAGLCIDKTMLIGACAATKLTKNYTVHNLKRSIGEVFGEKYAPLFAASEGQRYSYVTLQQDDSFLKKVCLRLAAIIDEARVARIGDDERENVWPIPYERLVAFASHGVFPSTQDGFIRYTVSWMQLDFGDASPTVLIWPPARETRELCFANSGGGRTPVDEIQEYPINWEWYRTGFTQIVAHPTEASAREYAEAHVLRRAEVEAQQASREAELQRAQEEFEAMMRGEYE